MASGAVDPWAWAGLLKWTLNHMDGTSDTANASPMSEEDKAFLEKVMKEGIIDETERMRFILTESTKAMEYYQTKSKSEQPQPQPQEGGDSMRENTPPISEEALTHLLQELRDIVEQIDYARAFCSLQGLAFLLGCISERTTVPESIRIACTGIISTLCQNNPPVQQELLEKGALKTLSDLFFMDDTSTAIQAKLMQAMGSMVRNHELAEKVFCSLEQSPSLFVTGLMSGLFATGIFSAGPTSKKSDSKSKSKSATTLPLQNKTLFFLQALVLSDTGSSERAYVFGDAICIVADHFLGQTCDAENNQDDDYDALREMSIAFLEQLLEQKRGVNIILQRKSSLAALGVQRITKLRSLTKKEDVAFYETELSHWEAFMVLLARAEPEKAKEEATSKE